MKKYRILLIFILLIIIIICILMQIKNRISKIEDNLLISNDLNMEIKEGTLTNISAVVVFTEKLENWKGKYEYSTKYGFSQWYKIEKKYGNLWIEKNEKNIHFVDSIYYVTTNGKLEIKFNWKKLYGKLGKGKYRLVTEVSILGTPEYKYIFTEFNID